MPHSRLSISLLVSLCLHFTHWSAAQSWNWVFPAGGETAESLTRLAVDPTSGEIFVGGTFSESFSWGTTTLEAINDTDVFLGKLSANGDPIWAVTGGSQSNDQTTSISLSANGQLFWTGQYWVQGFFEDEVIEAVSSTKAYYLASYAPEGTLDWVRSINGSDLKVLSDCTPLADGGVAVTGYFTDSLLLADTALVAPEDQRDLFVARYDAQGELLWARHYGESGRIDGRRIREADNGDLLLCGNFQGRVAFAEDTLISVITDLDVFLARLTSEGEPIWGRTPRGVFEDLVNGLTTDEEGSIYLAGSFSGEMRLSEELSIITPGIPQNLYVMKYTAAGSPVWARGLAIDEFNDASFGTDLAYHAGQLLLSGHFFGDLLVDDAQISATGSSLNGYLASFRATDGSLRRLRRIGTAERLQSFSLGVDQTGRVTCGGNFNEAAVIGPFSLANNGSSDIYVAQIEPTFTPVRQPATTSDWQLSPNPVQDRLWLEITPTDAVLEIIDSRGQIVMQLSDQREIMVNHLPAGMYFLRRKVAGQVEIRTFVKM